MWDGGVHHIEVSPVNALTNKCEMAIVLVSVLVCFRCSAIYPALLKAAFGSPEINSQRLLRSLAQFTSMLVSAGSKYDKHMRQEAGGAFTGDEEAGYVLFKKNSSACHKEPLFTDKSYRSNGLDLFSKDRGRDSITNDHGDRGKFRVPSLRNVEVTGPYMHDGRLSTLKQVLEHYNRGVKKSPNLDPLLHNGYVYGIKLSTGQQGQLIAFLKTLTDHDFIKSKR